MSSASKLTPYRKLQIGASLLFVLLVVLGMTGHLLRMELWFVHSYRSLKGFRQNFTNCQYRPSCSEYGLLVLERDGLVMGNLRLAKRFSMCSPIGAFWRWYSDAPALEPAPGDVISAQELKKFPKEARQIKSPSG